MQWQHSTVVTFAALLLENEYFDLEEEAFASMRGLFSLIIALNLNLIFEREIKLKTEISS